MEIDMEMARGRRGASAVEEEEEAKKAVDWRKRPRRLLTEGPRVRSIYRFQISYTCVRAILGGCEQGSEVVVIGIVSQKWLAQLDSFMKIFKKVDFFHRVRDSFALL